jgi:hypothetical protein
VCPGLRARVEVDAEVEVDGLKLGFMLRLARRLDVDCWLEKPFDLISRYFFIVGVSGAVKLETLSTWNNERNRNIDQPVHSVGQ